jgi:polysaccharide chain length determinant protein (PEP-CTERM system associated)
MGTMMLLLRRQLNAAWRHRWWAVLFTWAVCAAGWAFTFTIPNSYESSARLYVDADVVLTPLLRGLAIDNASAQQLDVLQRTLLSRPNLEKLISKTSLELNLAGPSDRESLVERLATDIRITPQTRNLFTISYRNKSPQLAYDVVRAMLTTFVESKAGNNRADLENAGKFLNQQINQYEQQLRDAERKRADFRARYVDVLPGADGGVSRLEGAQGQVRDLTGQLQDAVSKRDTLTRELSNTPPVIVTETDGVAGGGNNRLREAERTLRELRLRFTDANPDVISQRQLIASLRNGGGDDATTGDSRTAPRNRSASNPVYEALKTRVVDNESVIASLTRQANDATKERDRLETIARSAPQLQADYANVNRDYDVVRKNYDDLLARRESMRISSAADAESDKVRVQIIDPPQVPQNPVAPKRALLLTGVLAGGLAAGAGLAFLLAQLDQSFHSIDDLRDLGFPVVGGVSMLVVAAPLVRRVVQLGLFAAAVALPFVFYSGLLVRLLRQGTSV